MKKNIADFRKLCSIMVDFCYPEPTTLMKKIAAISLFIFAITSAAQADWRWNKDEFYNSKGFDSTPVEQTVTGASYCYDMGFDLNGFVSGIWPEHANDGIGGGLALSYFFTRNFGGELYYAAHGQATAEQVFGGNLKYRFPIDDGGFCGSWAPYLLGGVGGVSVGTTQTYFALGGGIDIRLKSWGCTGIFADYTYGFVDHPTPDFSMIRMGISLPF